MKEKYEKPQITMDEYETADVLTTSGNPNNGPDLDIGGGI